MTYLIGVDCGGTHIVGQLWTAGDDHQLVSEITGGPGNVVLDPTGAYQNLTAVIDQLVAGVQEKTIDLILVGIAGVETTGSAAQIQADLQARYQLKTRVISDARLALLNGLSGEDGTLVIAGTGSVVYGRQSGQFFRTGGWGYILGDEGSAYDIARTALKHILTRIDAGSSSTLTQTLLTQLHADTVALAVNHFYGQDRKTNAQLALPIAELATHGNVEAVGILNTTTLALAHQILTLCERYATPKPTTIALSGSVLQHNPLVRQTLINAVHTLQPQLKFVDINTNNAHAVVNWHKWESQGGIQHDHA